jgi:hypothetical protein
MGFLGSGFRHACCFPAIACSAAGNGEQAAGQSGPGDERRRTGLRRGRGMEILTRYTLPFAGGPSMGAGLVFSCPAWTRSRLPCISKPPSMAVRTAGFSGGMDFHGPWQ